MARLVIDTIEPASKGLDTDTSPSELIKGYAPRLDNFLTDREGVTPIRGPIVGHDELEVGTNEVITGAWEFGDKVLIGLLSKNATSVREPWTVPYRPATAANQLATAQTTMKLVDLNAKTVTNVSGATATAIGGRGARLGSKVYGLAFGATTGALHGETYQFPRAVCAWTGSTGAPTALANAPKGGQDVIAHLNRLWVLGGIDTAGGGSAIELSALYWSDQGGPTGDTTAEWQDDVSGLSNKILVDSEDGDFGVALARQGENLVIFKRRSTHILYGYSPETFTLRPASRELGCLDQRSIVESGEAVYFLSEQGYYRLDNNGFTNLSTDLRTSLVDAAHQTVGNAGVDGGFASAVLLPNDYILLTIGARSPINGDMTSADFCGLLHTPTGRWSTFSSDVLFADAPARVGRSRRHRYACDGSRVVCISELTTPETVPAAQRGFDEVDDGGTPVREAIPATWWSRVHGLTSPGERVQLHRLLTDYVFQTTGADNSEDGWAVDLIDGDGGSLLDGGAFQVPVMGMTSSYPYRRRNVWDTFAGSTGDVQVRVSWEWAEVEDPPAVVQAELHGVHVEHQPSRQRR